MYKVLIAIFFFTNISFADNLSDLLNDIGHEASIGFGFGTHHSLNDYVGDHFINMNFWQASISAFIGSRDLQLRVLGYTHYSNGVQFKNGYVISKHFPFWELNGNIGIALNPFNHIYIPAFSIMGSFNYYDMYGDIRIDPGFYTSIYWNFEAKKGIDWGIEVYNNLIFDKMNSTIYTYGEEKTGNGGDFGARVYINFIGELVKNHHDQ